MTRDTGPAETRAVTIQVEGGAIHGDLTVPAGVTVHFAKEEEVYLPLLDAHLTPEAASDLYHEMERAAAEIRQGW